MPSTDRRTLLVGVAGLAGLAGCLDGHDDEQTVPLRKSPETPVSTRSNTPTVTDSPTETDPPSATPAGEFSLTPVEPSAVDGPLTVLPGDLVDWLRTAAGGETVRAHAGSDVYPVQQAYEPMPPLTAFDRVRIDADGDAAGVYDLDAAGGVRYELLAGAEAVDPPDDAEVIPVSDLSEDRRTLALAAIDGASGEDARVYPGTALGSWARTEFFGGYVAHEGSVYRGHELQQTDAAFFSTELWYTLSLSPADSESAPVTLRPADVNEAVRGVVDGLRSEHETVARMSRGVDGETAAAVERFAAEHPLLLTHDAVFRVGYE